jgi:thiol-disulfide isomerase/thioredoxin
MKKIFFLSILLFTICCKKNENKTIIKGNIPNLPDGMLYLYEDNGANNIDSVNTKNGIFKFTYNWKKGGEPVYLGINHIDNKGVFRYIGFPTQAKYKGAPLNQSRFLSDPTININGKIFDNTPKEFPQKTRLVDLKSPIITGKQTEALFHIDGDLFDKIDAKTIKIIKEKISLYPYSYHLLYKIEENKNSFSPKQVDEYLKLFKGDITESETYKKLFTYNQKRYDEKNTLLPLLENVNGKKSEILDPKYEKHLVVFWASWCGPCRGEIPLLKEIYSKNNNAIEFISVSIDEDKNAWKKALGQEQMNWKQFIVNGRDTNYEKIQMRFRLNGAIPYTVLVDNNLKIIKSTVGLSSEKDLEDFIKN